MNKAVLKKFPYQRILANSVDAKVTVVNVGVDESLNTNTTKFKQPVVGFVFGPERALWQAPR